MAASDGQAKLIGVIGDPVTHSLSPLIHEYWIAHHQLNAAYVPLSVSSHLLNDALDIYKQTGFIGFNVTIPHKEVAVSLMNGLDEVAERCQAVNTICVEKAGTLYGMNTDSFGFVELCRQEFKTQLKDSNIEHVVILGAGGAARAVIHACAELGAVKVTIANRTLSKAEELCIQMQPHLSTILLEAVALEAVDDSVEACSMLVNTIALHADLHASLERWVACTGTSCMIVDISYGRNGTEMTRIAHKVGRAYADGLAMLAWQAARSFYHWFGFMPEPIYPAYRLVRQKVDG